MAGQGNHPGAPVPLRARTPVCGPNGHGPKIYIDTFADRSTVLLARRLDFG